MPTTVHVPEEQPRLSRTG